MLSPHRRRCALKYSESVAKYAAPRDDPFLYPGERPNASFLLARNRVNPLVFAPKSESGVEKRTLLSSVILERERCLSTTSFLEECEVASLSERFAVVGYGSNPVPGQLVSKFGEDTVVPVLLAEMEDTDVVYNLISNRGYAFAELAIGQVGVNGAIAVTLLDDEQLGEMIRTEENYHLAHCPSDVALESGEVLKGGPGSSLYVFAGFRKVWVPKSYGGAVPIAELPSRGRSSAGMRQREFLELVVEEFGLQGSGILGPRELASRLCEEASWPEEPPKLKYMLQRLVDEDVSSLPSLASQLEIVQERPRYIEW